MQTVKGETQAHSTLKIEYTTRNYNIKEKGKLTMTDKKRSDLIMEYLACKARMDAIKANLMADMESTCDKTIETLDGSAYATYKDGFTPLETDMAEVKRVFEEELGREVPKREGTTRKPSIMIAKHKGKASK